MRVKHSDILARNKAILLPTDDDGMCSGISWEGVALYFAGNLTLFTYLINELCAIPIEKFNERIENNRKERIKLIKNLKAKILAENSLKYATWEDLSPEKRIYLEEKLKGRLALIKRDNRIDLMNAFLESITAYHYMNSLLMRFNNINKLPIFVDIENIFPLLLPHSLLSQQSSPKGVEFIPLISEAAQLVGGYTAFELRDYFKILTETLLTLPLQNKPITIAIKISGHIVSLCWDSQSKKNWFFLDANLLPTKNLNIKDYKNINEVFFKKSNASGDLIFLASFFYVKAEDVNEARNWLALCAKNPRWQKIHAITHRKAQSINLKKDCFLFLSTMYFKKKITMVNELLAKGSTKHINILNDQLFSPLILAINFNDFESSKLLIENGADVNLLGRNGNALYYAAYVDNLPIAQLLLEKGARIIEIADRTSTWNCIAHNGGLDLFHLFEKFRLKPSPKKYLEMLIITVKNGHFKLAEALISKVFNLNQFHDNNSPLSMAASYGHDEIVKLLIKNGADVNVSAADESTPLWWASKKGQLKTVGLLLEQGADPNKISADFSPLMSAVANNDIEIATLLIKHGANVNFYNRHADNSILFLAAESGQLEVVKLLLEYKANVNFCKTNGQSVIDAAIGGGHLDIVVALLKHGAQLKNVNDPKVLDLLCKAMAHNRVDVFNQLLLCGVSVNALNTEGETLLAVAAGNGALNWVKLIKQANINLTCQDSTTPLWHAVYHGQQETADFLINEGAQLNFPNNEGMTPLAIACWQANLPMVHLLIQSGAAVNTANKKKETPLYLALANKDIDIAKLLIENGADANFADIKNQTPLFVAIAMHPDVDIELIAFLINHTANLYQPNDNNELAITQAALNRRFDIVKLFLQKNPNFNYHSADAEIIFACAIATNELQFVKLFIEKGTPINNAPLLTLAIDQPNAKLNIVTALIHANAEVNCQNDNDENPLWLAAKRGKLRIIDELIENGAVVNNANKEGVTPLWIAAQQGHLSTVQGLLIYGANINQANHKGETPLMAAILNEQFETVALLLKNGANVHATTTDNESALSIAIATDQIDMVKLLLAHQANVNQPNQQGKLLFTALINKQLEIANLLMAYGAHQALNQLETTDLLCTLIRYDRHDVFLKLLAENFFANSLHQFNSQNMTPLIVAIKEGMIHWIQELIQLGANVNQIAGGTLPIFAAVATGDAEIAELLINHGAQINFKVNEQTLMHIAAETGNPEMIELLIFNNMDVNMVNDLKETPLAIAVKNGHLNVATTLLKHGADPLIANQLGAPPIFIAIEKNDIEMVKELFTPNLFSFATDRRIFDTQSGNLSPLQLTVFHVAALYGRNEIFKLLLERYGLAYAEVANNDNQTPCDLARSRGHHDIVAIITQARTSANLISQSVFNSTSRNNNNRFDPPKPPNP